TYENSPSLRSSPPRIPIPSTSLDGILESAMPHQGKRLFPQPVTPESLKVYWMERTFFRPKRSH
ncbi:MAG: hypothetical protein U9R77_08580, partial [Pseudomonadota bacterium]|nr:hypothetical protein [Pseudomonadota bacterium]